MAHRGRQNADEALALAVASGQTLRDAARTAGVSERTAARRWTEPDFRQRVNALREDMTCSALGRLAHNMAAAADTLARLLAADADNVKLAAARSILQLGVELRALVELEERLRVLEEESLANVEKPNMALPGFVRQLAAVRKGLKVRLYGELGDLLQVDLDTDKADRALDLFFRLNELEQEEGNGALERFLNGLPDWVANQIRLELRRLLNEEDGTREMASISPNRAGD